MLVACAAYWLTYLPVIVSIMLRSAGIRMLPDAVQFAITWIYLSSSALNAFLYIALHSSVRQELRRHLPRCRRPSVAAAPTRAADNDDGQRYGDCVDNGGAGAPVPVMTSTRVTQRMSTSVL